MRWTSHSWYALFAGTRVWGSGCRLLVYPFLLMLAGTKWVCMEPVKFSSSSSICKAGDLALKHGGVAVRQHRLSHIQYYKGGVSAGTA